MGNIHTKRRVRLGYEKVFDTAKIRMDLKRKHAGEGLTRARLKRQFGSTHTPSLTDIQTEPADQHDDVAEEIVEETLLDEDPASSDISALASRLQQDLVDDEDPPLADVDGLHTSIEAVTPTRQFFGTQSAILLKDLFNYKILEPQGQGLDIFKTQGIVNLHREEELYELATQETHVQSLLQPKLEE